jgi:hypothetical protein
MPFTPDDYAQLREDARWLADAIRLGAGGQVSPASDPRDEQIQAQRQEIARLRVLVTRVIEIPRLPHTSEQQGDLGRAYTRGWESVVALIDKALLPDEEQG